jgi:hypothetical protein
MPIVKVALPANTVQLVVLLVLKVVKIVNLAILQIKQVVFTAVFVRKVKHKFVLDKVMQ